MRTAAIVLAMLVMLLGVLVFSFMRDMRAEGERQSTAKGPAEEGPRFDLATPDGAESAGVRLVVETALADVVAEAVPEAERPGLVTLTGTWTVRAGSGFERKTEDGRFLLRQYVPRMDIAVEVAGGQFQVELPPEANFDVLEVELGGRRTEAVGNVGDLGIPHDRHLDFVARWVREVVLTVVDAQTRAGLSGLIVVGEGFGQSWEHPGSFEPEQVIVRDMSSPVMLPIPDHPLNSESLWVRAPGYAWGHVIVPRSVGGEFLLALHGGGTLSVTVTGAPPGVELILRLRANEDPEDYEGIRFETPLEGRGRIDLEDLRVERYFASVELGHRYRSPRVLAATEVHVRVGVRTEVLLDVSDFEMPLLASIAGRLVVPPEWELEGFGIHFNLIGQATIDGKPQRYLDKHQMQLIDSGRGEYDFAMDDVQTGSWELRFNPHGTTIAVELPPGGAHDVRLEVPPPAAVTVHVQDEAGQPLSDVDVHWMPDREGLESGGVLNQAGAVAPGAFRFTTPVGRVDVWVFSSRWSFRRQTFEVDAGQNDFTIETALACGVVLGVRDGDTNLRVEDFAPRIIRVGGDEEGHLADEDVPGLEQRFVVPMPGVYRIELKAPEGYLPVDPIDLTVPAGTFIDYVVDAYRR